MSAETVQPEKRWVTGLDVFHALLDGRMPLDTAEVRGVLVIESWAAGESHLLNVCVHPDSQGHGLGRAMVEHLLDRAMQKRATTMFLEVRPSNVVACQLYEKLGFVYNGVVQSMGWLGITLLAAQKLANRR